MEATGRSPGLALLPRAISERLQGLGLPALKAGITALREEERMSREREQQLYSSQPQAHIPSAEQILKTGSTHRTECRYSAMRRKEALIHATTRENLENRTLQPERPRIVWFHFTECPGQASVWRQKVDQF